MRSAKRLSEIAPFRVMELLARANELEAQGENVIHLEVGEPDFDTPPQIVAAGKQALDQGHTKYTDARGIPELRYALSAYYESRFGISISPTRIFVTSGASGGLLLLTALLLDSGDNLLMTDPGYPCNRHFLSSFDAEGILVPVTEAENYQLNPGLISQYWNDRTRGILIASPANPTGAVLSENSYRELSACLQPRQGMLIVDEIYQGLAYADDDNCTVLNVDPDAFVVNSFSKYFGMTGWRLGWLVVPEALSSDLEKLAQNLFICPSAIAQYAALAAFTPQALAVMEGQRDEFRQRRDYLVPALRGLGLEIPLLPAGAFYVYAKLPSGFSSERFCKELLEEEFVAITPGLDFGFVNAGQFVRISYTRSLSQLKEAVSRIKRKLA